MYARLAELERRVGNLGRFGKVAQADYPNARVKVQIGRNVTDWLPWMTCRAGGDVTWHAPEVGEQVFVVSVAGEYNCGFVIPAIFQDSASATEDSRSPDIHKTAYKDGAVIKYDRAQHIYTADLTEAGKALVITGAATTEQTNAHIKTNVGSTTSAEMTDGKIVADVSQSHAEITPEQIKANCGETSSVTITPAQISLAVGGTSILITDGGIVLTVDGASMQLTGASFQINKPLSMVDGASLTLDSGTVAAGGRISSGDDVTAKTVSLHGHIHSGVSTGGGTTGTPI